MYSTRTRVHARIPNGHRREEKRACRTKIRGQVGKDRRACLARGELNGPRAPRQADCRARRGRPTAARAAPTLEVGEDVCVGVRVGPVEFKLYDVREGRSDQSGHSPPHVSLNTQPTL